MKICGIVIVSIVLYFFIDYTLEYHYWKKTQLEAFNFIKSTINDIKSSSKSDLENELKDLKNQFESGKKFSSPHERVEKTARLYILNEAIDPPHREPAAFPGGNLAQSCHFDLLMVVYQKEMGLPPTLKNEPAFNSFCNGWNKLDQEFTFGHSPHARSELRY